MTDLAAIRERHARDMDNIPLNGAGHIGQRFGQAHADRGTLLAALDRLAAVTVEEIAQVIVDRSPWEGARVSRMERDTAAAILTLVRARVAE